MRMPADIAFLIVDVCESPEMFLSVMRYKRLFFVNILFKISVLSELRHRVQRENISFQYFMSDAIPSLPSVVKQLFSLIQKLCVDIS